MSAELKIPNINTHVVDILGNVTGRDQPVMKMDKAVQLVNCLDKEVFTNNDYVFFDPFCKAGEILLATALVSLLNRSQKQLVRLSEVIDELYKSNRYFALAPDERHYNLSLRTFYGNEKSHDQKGTQNIRNGAYLSEIDGRLDKQKFKQELSVMLEYIKQKTGNKKIIAVGNPPYQEEDEGHGKGKKPIFNFFIETLINTKNLNCKDQKINKLVVVIPARWFSTGKGLDKFRQKIISCNHLKSLVYFDSAKDIFPTVFITGGVCFFNWSINHNGPTLFKNRDTVYNINLSKFDIIPDDPLAGPIVDKILTKWSYKFVVDTAWSRKPFGLQTNYFHKDYEIKAEPKNIIKCFIKGRRIKYILRSKIQKKFK